MEQRRWFDYIPAYIGWAVVAALGFWLLLISRLSFLGVLSAAYIDDSVWRAWRAGFFDKVYFVTAGMLWLVVVVVTEAHFRKAAGLPDLWKRMAKVVGIELLLVFGADLTMLILQGLAGGTWSRWLILVAELALGVAISVYARHPAASSRP